MFNVGSGNISGGSVGRTLTGVASLVDDLAPNGVTVGRRFGVGVEFVTVVAQADTTSVTNSNNRTAFFILILLSSILAPGMHGEDFPMFYGNFYDFLPQHIADAQRRAEGQRGITQRIFTAFDGNTVRVAFQRDE